MTSYKYDSSFDPPAPVLPIKFSPPLTSTYVSAIALIDTGADMTVIPRSLTTKLSLQRVDIAYTQGVWGNVIESPVFSAKLRCETGEIKIIRVISWDENYAILGRDLINQCKLNLDGPKMFFDIGL